MIPDQEIPVKNLPPDLYNKILAETSLKLGDFQHLLFKIYFDKRLDAYFCGLVTSDLSSSYPLGPETSKEMISFLLKSQTDKNKPEESWYTKEGVRDALKLAISISSPIISETPLSCFASSFPFLVRK